MIAATHTVGSRSFLRGPQVRVTGPQQAQRARTVSRIVCEDAPEKKSAAKAKAATLRTEFPTAEAVQGEVDRLRSEMFTMRIKFAKREEYQPAQYKALRKRVAQLLTIQRERTLEQGVTRREARALERRTLVEAGLRQF
ncbi:hypothetical protein M9435_006264 [Picochlorum sp. BPE23]|nr:hypothetical protein M9435_006264 [Picochlorum sp. BPE23]